MKKRKFRSVRDSGSLKLTALWSQRLLLAILAFGIIVLAPLPAFAYEPPTEPVEDSVIINVDISAFLWIDYTGEIVQFEVDWHEIDDWEDGSVLVKTEDDLLWCANGDWWINIWRSEWVVIGDVGDPNLDLWLEYRYQDEEGDEGGQFYQITTTPTLIEEGEMGCFGVYDFDWHLKKLNFWETHKGNYQCIVYFDLWDP